MLQAPVGSTAHTDRTHPLPLFTHHCTPIYSFSTTQPVALYDHDILKIVRHNFSFPAVSAPLMASERLKDEGEGRKYIAVALLSPQLLRNFSFSANSKDLGGMPHAQTQHGYILNSKGLGSMCLQPPGHAYANNPLPSYKRRQTSILNERHTIHDRAAKIKRIMKDKITYAFLQK